MFPLFSLFGEVGWRHYSLEKLAPNIETSSETTTKQEFHIPCYRASSQRFDCFVILMTQAPCRPSNFLHVCPSNNTGTKLPAAPSSARCLGEDVAVVPMRWTGKCPAVDECTCFFYLNGYWRTRSAQLIKKTTQMYRPPKRIIDNTYLSQISTLTQTPIRNPECNPINKPTPVFEPKAWIQCLPLLRYHFVVRASFVGKGWKNTDEIKRHWGTNRNKGNLVFEHSPNWDHPKNIQPQKARYIGWKT